MSSGVAKADNGDAKEFLGAWSMLHEGPEGYFREFISFADGGVVTESNSFLHTATTFNFAPLGGPGVMRASDGFGNWERLAKGMIKVAFRKMIFNTSGQYMNMDLRARGVLRSDGETLVTDEVNRWLVELVAPSDVDDPSSDSVVLGSFGVARSKGVRIR
jgi:hypothetical protein